jgi:hypothetical protein
MLVVQHVIKENSNGRLTLDPNYSPQETIPI